MELAAILKHNRATGAAIAALNFSDMWDLLAISNAARRVGCDIMVAANSRVARAIGVDLCTAMVAALDSRSPTRLFLHLDHSDSPELCVEAVDAGFPSVMIDGSMLALEGNIRVTREVVAYAHEKGVVVEAEIGRILGRGVEGGVDGGSFLADPDEAVELVESTGVDSLAVGIGTAHGLYQGEPDLRFDLLEEIAGRVGVPLVLHGGTGIPDADIRRAIGLGISKVNVGTMIHLAYMHGMRRELAAAGENPYTLEVIEGVLPGIEAVVADRLAVITQD